MALARFPVFEAAARYRSVTRASEELYITQPAVTKQLKALEGDDNADLYRRYGRGIELTEAGHTVLKKINKILGGYESSLQTIRKSHISYVARGPSSCSISGDAIFNPGRRVAIWRNLLRARTDFGDITMRGVRSRRDNLFFMGRWFP